MIEVGEQFSILEGEELLGHYVLASPVREYRGFIMLPVERNGNEYMPCFAPELPEPVGPSRYVELMGARYAVLTVSINWRDGWDRMEIVLRNRIDQLWEEANGKD